ncbi:hypothetical protein [Cognatiyoonia sp.]|uniref:hypothetical protein n=1 Tax=Cognatiyoonia sp. TaxID=2211652 RepID=UPI003F6A103A
MAKSKPTPVKPMPSAGDKKPSPPKPKPIFTDFASIVRRLEWSKFFTLARRTLASYPAA